MAVLLSTHQRRTRAMSARAEWRSDTCRPAIVSTIPTVGTNLAVHPTTGFGFKPYHQRPKETLL